MGSTFFKRYDLLRNNFYAKTKQFPQMRTSAEGKSKASGLATDLQGIDGALDSPDGVDHVSLTKMFQSWEKHARSYAQQIDAKPGVGVLDWMTKTQQAFSENDKKEIINESRAFGRGIE